MSDESTTFERQIVLDTETTGLEHRQGHRIIEIGCVELINRKLTGNNYHIYLNPQREIDQGAIEVHGITNDYLAENAADGIRIAREIMQKLGWNKHQPYQAEISYQQPLYPAEELRGIVPEDPKKPFDMREVVARIADGSDFLEFKGDFDNGTICGHIDIEGQPCGVIGNNSPITAKGAVKGGQFIQLCEQSGTPLLFLTNTTGFLVGTEPEQAGIIKHGAKFIQAVTNCTVPKITIIVGGSYGAGNYAMAGRGMDPRFLFAWPRSVVSVMGPAQAGR